jgi:hypothetical protein
VFWALLFPFGIPAGFLYLLHSAQVPQLAVWKRDCAWLRSIVQRALVIGVHQPFDFDVDSITTDSISTEHLRVLHKAFVDENGIPDESLYKPKQPSPVAAGSVERTTTTSGAGGVPDPLRLPPPAQAPSFFGTVALAQQAASGAASEGGGADGGGARESGAAWSRGASSTARTGMPGMMMTGLAASRLRNLLGVARQRVATATAKRTTTMRRTLSTMLWQDEREHLLTLLLMWAKHDKTAQVAEPRENLLRWRTVYEWEALRAAGAQLGARDTAERAAFFKYRFLFADFAVHAWYWCVPLCVRGWRCVWCCAHVPLCPRNVRESVDLSYKLFLCSLIAFIAPRTSVQCVLRVRCSTYATRSC